MNIAITKKPKSVITLTIEIPWDEVQPYLKRAANEYGTNTAVHGFRKGQAPYAVIEQRVGKDALFAMALETMVSHTYFKALKTHDIETIGAPQIDIKEKTHSNTVRYEATAAVVPAVTLAAFDKIKVEQRKVEVSEEETNKFIDELRRMRAIEREVNEPAVAGHKVTVSYHISQDHVPLEGSSIEDSEIILGKTQTLPEFSAQITGMRAGEEKKFTMRFPDTWARKELAGRTMDVELKMKKVAVMDLPVVDDAFASLIGKFKTVQELKDRMHDNIRLEKEDEEERRRTTTAVEELVKASVFEEIPEILIESETGRIIEEIEGQVQQYGVAFESWLEKMKKTREALRLELMPQAIERVKATLVLRVIAREQEIVPEEKDILEEVEKIMQQTAGDPAAQERVRTHAFHEYLKNQIVKKKAMEWLKKKVVRD